MGKQHIIVILSASWFILNHGVLENHQVIRLKLEGGNVAKYGVYWT